MDGGFEPVTWFNTAVDVNSTCTTLTVEDISSYPLNGSLTRDRVALIGVLRDFTTGDLVAIDLGNPGGNTLPGSWTFQVENNHEYDIFVAILKKWVAKGTYGPNKVIYFEEGEAYYANTSGGTLTIEVPGVDSEWEKIVETDLDALVTPLDLLISHFQSYPTEYGFSLAYVLTECEYNQYTLTKTACNSYTIVDNDPEGTEKNYIVLPYDEFDPSVVKDITTWDGTLDSGSSVDITVDGDGVYIVIISYANGEDTVYEFIAIYEFCSLYACWQSLIIDVLCGEWDPCCTTCDPETLSEMQLKRETLNKVGGLYRSMQMKIELEKAKFFGHFDSDTTRLEYVSEVNTIITQLIDLTSRCGLCDNESNSTSTTTGGCSSC